MGTLQAMALSETVQGKGIRRRLALEQALIVHFRSNHYPPLPFALIPVATRIINKVKKHDWSDVILPKGITYRGSNKAPISECIEAWHLESFLGV